MNRPRALYLLAILGVVQFASGCAGGQTGEEPATGRCSETQIALQLAQPSPLGISAQDVLDATGGTTDAPGHWLPVANLPYGPESGASSLKIVLGAVLSARFVKAQAGNSEDLALPSCADRIEVTVVASASTSGGALDEQFQALLTASTKDEVSLQQAFDPARLSGQFAFDPKALDAARFTSLTLRGDWLAGSFAGGLAAELEVDSGSSSEESSVSFSDKPLACFGTPNDCAQ
jgi:hypothetical protein